MLRFPRGLYGITPEWDDTPRLLDAITQAAAGGLVALQWRRKTAAPGTALQQARQVVRHCRELGVVSLINDDWRLASMLDADGVHLGRDDGSVTEARQALGPDKLIGSSCYNDAARARKMLELKVDYIAFGSMYPSSVKPDAVRATLKTLADARALSRQLAGDLPRAAVVAIGGITPDNAEPVIQAGADSVALITALFDAPDIRAAAQHCARLFLTDGEPSRLS